jgi:hypothetical protein
MCLPSAVSIIPLLSHYYGQIFSSANILNFPIYFTIILPQIKEMENSSQVVFRTPTSCPNVSRIKLPIMENIWIYSLSARNPKRFILK